MDFIRVSRPVSLALLGGRGHYEAVVQAVMNAEHSVWIATANLKELMVEDARVRPGRRRTARNGEYRSVLQVFDELVVAACTQRHPRCRFARSCAAAPT
jgi:hypothetical protein